MIKKLKIIKLLQQTQLVEKRVYTYTQIAEKTNSSLIYVRSIAKELKQKNENTIYNSDSKRKPFRRMGNV